mgnify:CR=1 FL=1
MFLIVHDVPLGFHLARVERDRIYTAMERDAFTIAGKVSSALDPATLGSAESAALMVWAIDAYSVNGDAKVVIVDSGGYLAASSSNKDTLGADFTNRPEIGEALLGSPSSGSRASDTVGGHIVYVAVPVLSGTTVRGVVRLTLPETEINNRVRSRIIGIVLAGIMTVIAATVAAFVSASAIARRTPAATFSTIGKWWDLRKSENLPRPSTRWPIGWAASSSSNERLPATRRTNCARR